MKIIKLAQLCVKLQSIAYFSVHIIIQKCLYKNLTMRSVAKSAIFPQNWDTFKLYIQNLSFSKGWFPLLYVWFHSNNPQKYIFSGEFGRLAEKIAFGYFEATLAAETWQPCQWESSIPESLKVCTLHLLQGEQNQYKTVLVAQK